MSRIIHASEHGENTALGMNVVGLLPEDLEANTPALHRPTNKGTLLFDIPGPSALKKIRIFNVVGLLALLGILVYVLKVFYDNGQLDGQLWASAVSADAFMNFYLPGFWMTIQVASISVVASAIFGLVFGSFRLLPSRASRAGSLVVVEFARAVPVLLMMIFFWRFFSLIGVGESSSFWAVFVALTLYNGSVIAELVRSGVKNLPKGQSEAAISLGLTRTKSLIKVELPQATRNMLPAMVTQLVVVVKDTALGSIILYTDLLQEARRLGSANFNVLQTMIVASVIYFVVCFALSKACEHWSSN